MPEQGLQDQLQLIDSLDLTRVKERYIWDPRWLTSAASCAKAEVGYRRFLRHCLEHPDKVVPSLEFSVERFWIAHILDTEQYIADCQRIFGRVIHYVPYQPNKSELAKAKKEGADNDARAEHSRDQEEGWESTVHG